MSFLECHCCQRVAVLAVADVDAAGAVVVADFGNALVVAVADVADVPPVDDYFDS